MEKYYRIYKFFADPQTDIKQQKYIITTTPIRDTHDVKGDVDAWSTPHRLTS